MDKIAEFFDEAAEWIYELTINKIPQLSISSIELMIIDTVAAALNSLIPTWARDLVRGYDVIESLPILSVMFDYDSTLLYYGHLGHGIVAPLFMSDSPGDKIIEAVASASEVSGRVAASLSLSNYRGQMMSSLHALSTSIMLSKLSDAKPDVIRRAMAYSIAYPLRPTRVGFMSLSKLLVAVIGFRHGELSYRLATRSWELIDPKVFSSFMESWGGVVLAKPLSKLGSRWHVDTLSIKKYPACSYAQTAIEAARDIHRELGIINPSRVERIVIRENALTYLMDRGHEAMIRGPRTPFTTLQFYTPYLVSRALLRGDLWLSDYSEEAVSDEMTWYLVNKVELTHDSDLTLRLLREPLPFGVAIGELGESFIKTLNSTLGLSSGELRGYDLDSVDLNAARKYMGVILEVHIDGRRIESHRELIDGFHGSGIEAKAKVALKKLSVGAEHTLGSEASTLTDILRNLRRAGEDEVRLLRELLVRAIGYSGRRVRRRR